MAPVLASPLFSNPRTGNMNNRLDSQALAALGATSVDHCAAATGLHANQETVGTSAADFGGLVSAFHNDLYYSRPRTHSGEPAIIANFLNRGNTLRALCFVML